MKTSKHNVSALGPAFIILAGIFWGSMGIFVRKLGTYGFNPIQIVCIRVVLAALVFCVVQLAKDPKGFRISLRDVPLFLGLGLGSILFFRRLKKSLPLSSHLAGVCWFPVSLVEV